VTSSRQRERGPHPAGQEAFRVLVQFPWQSSPLCSVKMEITVDEPLVLPVTHRRRIHGLAEAERRWTGSLVNLVKPLPPFDAVLEELRQRLPSLLTVSGSPGQLS
jgi:hypothetical protein